MTAIALVVAAGRAQRFGGERPKQYCRLGGIALLRHSLLAFAHHPGIAAVRTVIRPDDRTLYDEAAEGLDLLPPVAGGPTRQASVAAGLDSLTDAPPAHVLIHDAARPFVSRAVIDRVLDGLAHHHGVCAGVVVADSLKRVEAGTVAADVPRDGIWQAQTPQGFHFEAIVAAHANAAATDYTDDVSVARAAGIDVAMVPGDPVNIKITAADDLGRAERLLAAALPDIRVGQGYDVHRLGPGDAVRLCGIDVPHDRALIGHSDADVGLHAVTDALLGAIGDGDIGKHFPPGEARWRNADSATFVRHAVERVQAAGGIVAHIDVTLICEAPKIAPHREAMRARLADIVGLDPVRISVKATTTEGLGVTGSGEGIAAQATATVRLPNAVR